jgi:hypothetical protein
MTFHSFVVAHIMVASQPTSALALGAPKEDTGTLQSHFARHDDKRMEPSHPPQAQKTDESKMGARRKSPPSRQVSTAAPPPNPQPRRRAPRRRTLASAAIISAPLFFLTRCF